MPDTSTVTTSVDPERSILDRDSELTGTVRCRAYGTYSALLASPHEIDIDAAVQVDDILEVQPYDIDLNAIVATYLDSTPTVRKREYSRLFEVGDRGPPVPIREQQQFSHLAGIREDLLRFYDFFDYPLHQRYAWAPDHLSVLLEFCHLLCYRESIASADRLSHQLAQLDFASRHLLLWTPLFADRIDAVLPNSIYARVAQSLCDFVTRDYEWQSSTVVTSDESRDHE